MALAPLRVGLDGDSRLEVARVLVFFGKGPGLQQLSGVDPARRETMTPERNHPDPGRSQLAHGENPSPQARRRLPGQSHSREQALKLVEQGLDRPEIDLSEPERAREVGVPVANRRQSRRRIPGQRLPDRLFEQVRHAGQGRDDDPDPVCRQEPLRLFRDASPALRRRDRGAAELEHDPGASAGAMHRGRW